MNLFIRNERFSGYVRRFPQTTMILVLNILYFVYAKWFAKVPIPDLWGVYNLERVQEGEWYRLFSAMFTHIDFMHLFLNLISIYLFASVLEQLTKRWVYFAIYFGSGLFSYLCVFLFTDTPLTVGASGAVFGMLGALFYLSRSKGSPFDPASRSMLGIILLFNVIGTFLIPDVSIAGHFGGLLAGYVFANLLKIGRVP